GDTATVERLARRASGSIPGLSARPIRALAATEGPFLARARWLMIAVSLAVLALAGLAVFTAAAAAVIDRERELALLLALGCDHARAALLFLAEASLTGLAAGVAGAALAAALGPWLAGGLFPSTLA